MVKWCSKWLEQIDAYEVAVHLWAKYLDSHYCWCSLCNKKVKYDKSCGQALTRHANIDDHKKLSKLRFSNTAAHIGGSDGTIKSKDRVISIHPSLNNKVSAAEATWLFKVAEEDYSFRSCDDTQLVFKKMFPDSAISQKFTLSQKKASYVIKHALGPLVASDLCKDITKKSWLFYNYVWWDQHCTENKANGCLGEVLVNRWK